MSNSRLFKISISAKTIECFEELGPIITTLINYSFAEGCFPSIFKNAHVRPLLKKPSLPPEDLNNYRPISSSQCIAHFIFYFICLFHWIHCSEDPQRHHFLHRQRWSYCSHSSWSLCRIRHCWSFDSAIPSQKRLSVILSKTVMVFFVSQLAQIGGFTERYHLFIFHLMHWIIRQRAPSNDVLYGYTSARYDRY